MKKLCIFCGASNGNSDKYILQAQKVGKLVSEMGWGLVYGGGNVGIMGTIANTATVNGAEVIGVIPKSLLDKEEAHQQISKLHVVEDMHTRKNMMYDLSDAFLILPGGMGTLDEMFEILTWSQLGFHKKPVYVLNEFGFYTHILEYLKHSSKEGFIKPEHLAMINELKTVDDIRKIKI